MRETQLVNLTGAGGAKGKTTINDVPITGGSFYTVCTVFFSDSVLGVQGKRPSTLR